MDQGDESKKAALRRALGAGMARAEPGPRVWLAEKRSEALDALVDPLPEPELWLFDPADATVVYMLAPEKYFARLLVDLTLDVTEDAPAAMRVDARKLDERRHSAAFEIRRLGEVNEHHWTFDLGFEDPIEIVFSVPGEYDGRMRAARFARSLASQLGFFAAPTD